MLTISFLTQVVIMITGALAIFLTQQSNKKWQRYACFFGVLGEPFWLYTTFVNAQWGIFALACFYTYTWCLGIYNHWIKEKPCWR